MTDKKELDDFWDIDMLIPEKRNAGITHAKRPSFDTSTADVEENTETADNGISYGASSFTRFIPPHTAEEFKDQPKPILEYKAEHSLIHDVRIYDLGSKYSFYDRFLDDARRYRDRVGEECPAVPFFSYTPQYSQMNRSQLAYYLWWRDNVRKGIYLSADYSYVILYLYELINLSEESDRSETLNMMCELWLRYGDEHQFVFKYLSEWVCDFCLINRLPVPAEKIRSLYPRIMQNCLLKEFYVIGGNGVGKICADTLIEIASAYDYRKSRYATAERLPILKKHLVGVIDRIMSEDGDANPLIDGIRNNVADNSAVRTAYSGALCAGKMRKKIEIQYYSFSRSYELRYLVSDIMKYSENKLRKIWGIKSRLSIYALPTSIKNRIDEYFEELAPSFSAEKVRREMAETSSAEYEKLYDVPRKPLSLESASRIEESSWETTRVLVETFAEVDDKTDDLSKNVSSDTIIQSKNDLPETAKPELSVSEENEFLRMLGEKEEFLHAVILEDILGQRAACEKLRAPAEAIADEINELAADELGDVLLEECGGGYSVIEDYRELVENMYKK